MGKQLKTNQLQCKSNKQITRKEFRKRSRKHKKALKNEYFRKQDKSPLVKSLADQICNENVHNSKSKEERPDNININEGNSKTFKALTTPHPTLFDEGHAQEINQKVKLAGQTIKQRKRSLLEANLKEDKAEEQLNLNKRKAKTTPKSFINAGLHYEMQVCDSSKLLNSTRAELDLEGSESEFQDDSDNSNDNTFLQNERENITNYASDDSDEEEDDFNQQSEMEEDKGSYVPPHRQALQVGQNAETNNELATLWAKLKFLLNQLVGCCNYNIAEIIDGLYLRNSKKDMNNTLLTLISETLVDLTPDCNHLVMRHALLIAVLHANTDLEIGAHLLENFVLRFHSIYTEGQEVQNKELANILLMISYLYYFKVVHVVLVYNLLDLLENKFIYENVELILLVLQSVGLSMRKDDPIAFKDLELRLQRNAYESTEYKNSERVNFMLNVLFGVKNKDVTKLPQYDPVFTKYHKKLLRTLVHKDKDMNETQLMIRLDDFLHVEERGRWWIVESPWIGAVPQVLVPAVKGTTQYQQRVLDLARKHHMNTDNELNIFSIIMTAEDYWDATVKLTRLGLTYEEQMEIFYIILHCLLMEKDYNPYYSILATHFCKVYSHHRVTIKFLVQNKFKELSSMTKIQITNLAKFFALLCLEKILPITLLEAIKYSEMDKRHVHLQRQILLAILLTDDSEKLIAVFQPVSQSPDHLQFRERLRLFMHLLVLREINVKKPYLTDFLHDQVVLAEAALTNIEARSCLLD